MFWRGKVPNFLSQNVGLLNFPSAEAGSLNKCSRLARALGVTKFINMRDMILVTLCCVD
jgi:hypothetical protein